MSEDRILNVHTGEAGSPCARPGWLPYHELGPSHMPEHRGAI